jgi:hypothetical protein
VAGELPVTAAQMREAHRAEKYEGYFDFKQLKSVHTLMFTIILYELCAIATLNHPGPLPPKNYVRIVAFMP